MLQAGWVHIRRQGSPSREEHKLGHRDHFSALQVQELVVDVAQLGGDQACAVPDQATMHFS